MFWNFRKNFVWDLLGAELKLGEGGAREKSHAFAIVVPSQRGPKTVETKSDRASGHLFRLENRKPLI